MKAAVLGSPVSHSLSPVLHRAAYTALGLTGWAYTAIECDEAGLAGLLNSLDDTWAGLSLTMPLKRAVLALLDEVEPLAAEVGGANTVVFSRGRSHGYNTDVGGMVDALAEAGVRTCARALIIGGGATACSALAALRDIGVRAAEVAVRDVSRAGELRATARRLGVGVRVFDLASLDASDGAAGTGPDDSAGSADSAHYGLVICTVPPRAADSVASLLYRGPVHPQVVFDVAYDPWPTRLAAAAQQAGSIVVGGFELLLHQAGRQVELMTGHRAPLAAMRAAGLAQLAERHASDA
jgi:shikimate 5-dehydrogenase